MVLVPIPAGEFQMGSSISAEEIVKRFDLSEAVLSFLELEHPQHLVKIKKPFYLSENEVTQEQYEKVMGVRPWQGKIFVKEGPDYAETYVSWNEAVEFCGKLSEQEGVKYRLPTEAQWEYAYRAGTTTAYSFGDDASKLGQYAWYQENAWNLGEKYGHRVGQKLPNPWGLFDMHGNVFEWCQNWYAPYGSEKAVSDPGGPASERSRLLRGGSFFHPTSNVRSAFRLNYLPTYRFRYIGFRPSRTYNLTATISRTPHNTSSGSTAAPGSLEASPRFDFGVRPCCASRLRK